MTTLSRRRVFVALIGALTGACGDAHDAPGEGASAQLLIGAPSYNVDVTQTSASGLSSGAYMAVQLHVAHSSIMRGVGVFAGGPYACAQGRIADALTTCMSSSAPLDPAPFVRSTKEHAAAGVVDPVASLAGQRVFLFSGANDTTVNPAVMDGLAGYYEAFGADISFERRRPNTAHTMPTESYGSDCATTAPPYVGRCGYDGAGAALAHIYGALKPRASAASGAFVTIAQGDFVASPASHSLADAAYAYVPETCARGELCRIHVAFHGCQQYATSAVGDAFYRHAGYNEWADTNHLIVLYPQTIATRGKNPNGCWDWWGYDDPAYATKSGPQIAMVRRMIDHLASGASADGGAPPPPSPPSEDAGAGPECVVASNVEHVSADRARVAFGLVYARGSNQALGLYSPFVQTGLARVSANGWRRSATYCR